MLNYKIINGILYIDFNGELDHATAPLLRAKLDGIIAKEKYSRIVFDLSCLTFMDSTGVGLIMGRYKEARAQNRIICIRAPSPEIDKVLKVSGIYNVIPKIV